MVERFLFNRIDGNRHGFAEIIGEEFAIFIEAVVAESPLPGR